MEEGLLPDDHLVGGVAVAGHQLLVLGGPQQGAHLGAGGEVDKWKGGSGEEVDRWICGYA